MVYPRQAFASFRAATKVCSVIGCSVTLLNHSSCYTQWQSHEDDMSNTREISEYGRSAATCTECQRGSPRLLRY